MGLSIRNEKPVGRESRSVGEKTGPAFLTILSYSRRSVSLIFRSGIVLNTETVIR